MQFNTYIYMLLFLPVTILGYFVINKISYFFAKIYLAAVSMFFYAYAGLPGFQWLVISIIFNYLVVLLMKRMHNKVILWIGIIFNVVLLFYFKYTNFAILTINDLLHKSIPLTKMVLPIGISFFTFQQIAYIVDSYRGKLEKHSLLDYINYVTFFPKILMGPLVSPNVLLAQFHDESKRKISSENIVDGIQMFIIGLFKKVILADTFAKAVAWAWRIGDFKQISSMDIFLVMLAYTFQIYFDFSGYSDMAIASAKMLNFELPMNFDSPYKAYSIRDFWKRWHISLTKFLTEYIYFPLGGSKKGEARTYLNTMIVFLISGIWHGANWTFILWGILHGVFSIFDRLVEKFRKNIHPALQWMATFLTINVLWLLFRANSIGEWKHALSQMLRFQSTTISDGLLNVFVLPETKVITKVFRLYFFEGNIRGFWMLIFYLIGFILCLGFENAYRRKYKQNAVTAIFYALLFVFILTCIGSESVFVYFNF